MNIFQRLERHRALRRFAVILKALDGVLFGVREVTPGAPHIRDNIEIKRFMSTAILALVPSTVAAIWFWGLHAVWMILTSYICGGIVEVAFAVIRKRDIEEGFLVTGLIFPLVLPPTTPLWVVAVGIVFGTFFGKEVFGGTGRNIFNPALVGRLFITIAFPEIMSATWKLPFADAITAATPLGVWKSTHEAAPFLDLLLGRVAGSMGETFRIGIIVGGLLLMLTRVANWRVPVTYLLSVALFSLAGNLALPGRVAPPELQLLAGGLLFGAFFMSTDPVTSPLTRGGKYVFGILAGLLTVLIRSFSGFTEGVMFSIVFLNALTPLIDHVVLSAKYKAVKA
jgi:Na+-transporting NADH:ubiquinone oxidoreductase subunit B/electron transport complex protein RnfD